MFSYDVSSLHLHVRNLDKNVDAYQKLYQDCINEIHKYMNYHHESEAEYRSHISKIIKDIPKEIVVKNVLSV